MTKGTVLLEVTGRVAIATINRPEALNALNQQVMTELASKLGAIDNDPNIGCFVIAGLPKAFAAGADIKEMATKSHLEMFYADLFSGWEKFSTLRTPKIAAVSGYALGGGCELAMMCDLIFAGASAKFGQPEITLGVIPGMGGSQRLTRLIGRAKAMDMILTGRMIDAQAAESCGLVSRIFPDDDLLPRSIEIAEQIAALGKASTMMAREVVNRADEVSLAEGLLFERRAFHALFSTLDQKEGMAAFVEKRKARFTGA
jgi:enoyl-CoA hydratase